MVALNTWALKTSVKWPGTLWLQKIPEFMEALANKLNEAPEPDFGTWRMTHKAQYMELIKAFE